MSKNKNFKKLVTLQETKMAEEIVPEIVAEENTQAPSEPVAEVKEAVIEKVSEPVVIEEKRAEIKTSSFSDKIAELKSSGTTYQKNLISSLEIYISKMKPGAPVTSSEGARHQYVLWKTITALLVEIPADEFKKLWNILLAYFNEYDKTVFGDRYVFRFSEFWSWPEDELSAFQRILNLIKLTANANNRAANIKQVSMERTLDGWFSEEARSRIMSFYK